MSMIDVKIAAEEIKRHLNERKMDLIDNSLMNIELWYDQEDLDSGKYPEISKFTARWKLTFDQADLITMEDGSGFPNEEFLVMEAELKKVEDSVNSDAAYWKRIRDEVIPMYEKSPLFKRWQKRWKCVELFYDPLGLDITTTEVFTNVETGVKTRGKTIRQRSIPEGIVIRIDPRRQNPNNP